MDTGQTSREPMGDANDPEPTVAVTAVRTACRICTAYLERRVDVLARAIALRSFVRGVESHVVAREFMHGVHRRHLAGLSLSTRTATPDRIRKGGGKTMTIQRACNGCQKSLGDAREDELESAVAGLPLPDVRLECGCSDEAASGS